MISITPPPSSSVSSPSLSPPSSNDLQLTPSAQILCRSLIESNEDIETILVIGYNFKEFLKKLPATPLKFRLPLLSMVSNGPQTVPTPLLATVLGQSANSVRRSRQDSALGSIFTHPPTAQVRVRISYDLYAIQSFLRETCPPPSGVYRLSGEVFYLRKSRFHTWLDFSGNYSSLCLPAVDDRIRRAAAQVLLALPSPQRDPTIPLVFQQKRRNRTQMDAAAARLENAPRVDKDLKTLESVGARNKERKHRKMAQVKSQ